MDDILAWLQSWYLDQCNGAWEHVYGVKIDTLDNPGWSVDIDLAETRLDGSSMDTISIQRTEDDWIHCAVADNRFKGGGGPENLKEILNIFKKWTKTISENSK